MINITKHVQHPGVRRVLLYIRQRAHSPISASDFTKVAGLSRRGLLKAFVRETGKGPGAMLREYRMQLAQQLLKNSQLPIESVSTLCGYSKLNSFYISFRQYSGASPGHYRKVFTPRPERARLKPAGAGRGTSLSQMTLVSRR